MWTKTQLRVCVWVTLFVSGFGGSRKDKDFSVTVHGGLPTQSFLKSVGDANLMFEFLLGGLVIDDDDNISLWDEELASMRQGRAFVAHFNDHVPKTLVAMEKLLDRRPPAREKVLGSLRFETVVMGAVYSAYQIKQQKREDEHGAWGDVFARLANATLLDLRTLAISN